MCSIRSNFLTAVSIYRYQVGYGSVHFHLSRLFYFLFRTQTVRRSARGFTFLGTMLERNTPTDDHIRARLLRTLGILHPGEQTIQRPERALLSPSSLLDNKIFPTQQPLKNHDISTPSKKDSRIQFNCDVSVVPIPSHSRYSDRVKKQLWSNSKEISMNARRNILEFSSEEWNWEKVLEEDAMYLDTHSNELIHPVHLLGLVWNLCVNYYPVYYNLQFARPNDL